MTTAPTLTTERLTLRGLSLKDAGLFERFFATDHSKFYDGPTHANESWRKMSMYAGHWMLHGYGPWAITLNGDDNAIGMCGPWDPRGWPEREITYFLAEDYCGHGYATGAVHCSLDWCYKNEWTTAISVIEPANSASINVAERAGAQFEAEHHWEDFKASIYRYPTPQNLNDGTAA